MFKPQKFFWHGINKNGIKCRGQNYAVDSATLKIQLAQKNITVLNIRRCGLPMRRSWRQTTITTKDIANLTRQLALLLTARIPLRDALNLLKQETTSLAQQELLKDLHARLTQGDAFAAALRAHSRYFDELYCQTVAIGEQTARLAELLTELADAQEQRLQLRSRLFKALQYPLIITIVTILVTMILLGYVVPQFAALFANRAQTLPLLTQVIIELSQYIQDYGLISIIIFITIGCLFWRGCRQQHAWIQPILHTGLRWSWLHTLCHHSLWARLCSLLAVSLQAGIPLLPALEGVTMIITLPRDRAYLIQVIDAIRQGASLHQALADNWPGVPIRIQQLVRVGEETGQLGACFQQGQNLCQQQVAQQLGLITQWLEPVIMLILSSIVGLLIVAMYLPIFEIGGTL